MRNDYHAPRAYHCFALCILPFAFQKNSTRSVECGEKRCGNLAGEIYSTKPVENLFFPHIGLWMNFRCGSK